jgi:type VI secretion system protein VasG
VELNLKSLIGKLDDTCRQALEAAAGLALSRTNYDIEIEHWFNRLLERQTSDVAVIASHFDVDAGRLAQDVNRQIDGFKTGNGRSPAIAPNLVKLIREAWLVGSLEYGSSLIRSGHLLLALLTTIPAFVACSLEINVVFTLEKILLAPCSMASLKAKASAWA